MDSQPLYRQEQQFVRMGPPICSTITGQRAAVSIPGTFWRGLAAIFTWTAMPVTTR
ncbi:hypothetical protein M2298_003066 [Brevibacillus sp. 1238]|uniref:hypothetical protein n=1 Tax=Brevibacillus TaxID=55080 RepID=UPI00247CC9DD|nr:hypothetical protein [Brevibacillus sp. 1238]